MAEQIQNVVRFLRREPQPAQLRVFTLAGDKELVRIVGSDSRKWSRAADTIDGLKGTRIDCIDAKGQVIRTGELPEDEEAKAAHTRHQSETEHTITTVARLLKETMKEAAEQHKAAYELAFNKMVELTGLAFQRMHALEKAHVHALRLKDIAGGGSSEEGSVLEQMVMAYMNGQQLQMAARMQATATANGAAPTPEPEEDAPDDA
jgi:uncharacterized protein with beta-barrel porin domain